MSKESRLLYISIILLALGAMYLTLEMGLSQGRLEKMEEWKKLAYPDAVESIDTTHNQYMEED